MLRCYRLLNRFLFCFTRILSRNVGGCFRIGGNSFNQGPGLEKTVCYLCLHHDVLVEKLDLVLEITTNDILQESDVSEMTSSLLKDDFHLLSGEGRVVDDLERRVAAEHLEMKLTPLLADSGEHKLAVFHAEILEHHLEE